MNELSLFSGAGGGLLGSTLLGWKPVGYVEYSDYCQRVLRGRIIDGVLPNAPIFSDIRAFISEGYAESYTGMVDIITAGFPCQPFSQAGRRKGASSSRNLWPETAEVIRRVQPRAVFLENTIGIRRYLPVVLSNLRRMGFCVPYRTVAGASSVGAPHIRRRIWIPAYSDSSFVWDESWGRGWKGRQDSEEFERSDWWAREPGVDRVADGVAHRVDRLRAIGNGQVPAVVQSVWNQALTKRERKPI